MKPLYIFLLLLIILIISLLFRRFSSSYFKQNNNKEGLISFAESIQNKKYVYIPQYSSTNRNNVIKLYDSIFYDLNNGNIIEVDGITYKTDVDMSGLSVNGIYVVQRDQTKDVKYYENNIKCGDATYTGSISSIGGNVTGNCSVVSPSVSEANIMSLNTSTNAWVYYTNSLNTDKYIVFYISFDVMTFVHIMNNTTNKHITTYCIANKSAIENSDFNTNADIVIDSRPDDISDDYNGKMVLEKLYDNTRKVYQISKTVKFDLSNGYLIVNKKDKTSIDVYNRLGSPVSNSLDNKPDFIRDTTFNTWIVSDNAGSQVLYMPLYIYTIVFIISYNSKTGSFIAKNISLLGTDADVGGNQDTRRNRNKDEDTSDTTDKKKDKDKKDKDKEKDEVDTDKYILKTQVIPPVCPSCPACPSFQGVCNNCGGNGGKGVIHELEEGGEQVGGAIEKGITGTVDLAKTAVGGTVDLAKSAAGGTVDLAKSAATGTVDLAKSTATGTVDLAKSAVGGTVDLAKSAAGGAVDLLEDTASGALNLLKMKGTDVNQSSLQQQQQQQNIANTYNVSNRISGNGVPGVDMYSYYGALVPKAGSGNYVPVTADFSKFGL